MGNSYLWRYFPEKLYFLKKDGTAYFIDGTTVLNSPWKLHFSLKEHKVILFPMSDLSKKIEFGGEIFRPIERLTTAFKYHVWDDERFKLTISEDCVIVEVYSKVLNVWGIHATAHLTTSKLNMLLNWRFDIYNLVGKGFATGVNKENNPYA